MNKLTSGSPDLIEKTEDFYLPVQLPLHLLLQYSVCVCVCVCVHVRSATDSRWIDKADLIMFMKTPTARARTRLLAYHSITVTILFDTR